MIAHRVVGWPSNPRSSRPRPAVLVSPPMRPVQWAAAAELGVGRKNKVQGHSHEDIPVPCPTGRGPSTPGSSRGSPAAGRVGRAGRRDAAPAAAAGGTELRRRIRGRRRPAARGAASPADRPCRPGPARTRWRPDQGGGPNELLLPPGRWTIQYARPAICHSPGEKGCRRVSW